MGRGFVQYHLPDSGRDAGVAWSAFIDYRLPDESKLHILQQAAWCPACSEFVIAEYIPTLEELETEIARLQSGDPDALKTWEVISNGGPFAERVAELRKYIAWRKIRESPARCLECGAVGPIPTPASGEFAHPHTGERVTVVWSGWADMEPWCAEFSPEGELIAKSSSE